ncbi:hypothetical protein FNO01nite_15810 [Flavobacterium noncentrifugens]|nr:hypothetical protein FNO01nite_15810 [Flavobacterium noncentrifugens]
MAGPVAVPVALVTVTAPDVVAKAVIVVLFTIVKLAAAVPPNFTEVVVKKFVPVIVMVVRVLTFVGETAVIVGTCAKASAENSNAKKTIHNILPANFLRKKSKFVIIGLNWF